MPSLHKKPCFLPFLSQNRNNILAKVYTREHRYYCQGGTRGIIIARNKEKRERKVKCGAKGRQRRKDCEYPPPFSFVHQEVPRLRGHSKFSRLFRQRRESPSKLMLPGHAISPSYSSLCSIFLACSIPFPPLEQDAAWTYLLQLPVTPAAYFIGYGLVNRMFCRDSSRVMLVVARDDLIPEDWLRMEC